MNARCCSYWLNPGLIKIGQCEIWDLTILNLSVKRFGVVMEDIFEYAEDMGCQELHMGLDPEVGLKAIIAIHSTLLGPALGGCRCLEYATSYDAMVDAIRLAKAMTYKAALAKLPLGGGKMVLLKPNPIVDREAYFKAVGRFVDTLNGRYITAVDSGTRILDMDRIATETRYVTSTSQGKFSVADPAVLTAFGVEKGILAALQFKLGKKTFHGVHVAIQGVGSIGYLLAKQLSANGARVTVYDIDSLVMTRCVRELDVSTASSLDELVALECDVFSPCALGAVLNDNTIPKLKAKIVAGCANNQLENSHHGLDLAYRDILYAPDYVINSGGLIHVAAQFMHTSEMNARKNIAEIFDTLMEIFQYAEKEKRPTNEIADMLAEEYLAKNT